MRELRIAQIPNGGKVGIGPSHVWSPYFFALFPNKTLVLVEGILHF